MGVRVSYPFYSIGPPDAKQSAAARLGGAVAAGLRRVVRRIMLSHSKPPGALFLEGEEVDIENKFSATFTNCLVVLKSRRIRIHTKYSFRTLSYPK